MIKKALGECCPAVCLEWVRDGDALISYLKETEASCIVLLDINMPRKSGLEALSEIRERPELSHIPIVILTTSESDEDILRAYQEESNTYVRKPDSFGELKDFLTTFRHYSLLVRYRDAPFESHHEFHQKGFVAIRFSPSGPPWSSRYSV